MNTPKIKICGITTKEQAIEISSFNIHALGFVLYPPSPRYIDPESLSKITKVLPPFIKSVGVVVNETLESLNEIWEKAGLDLIQLSGDENPEYCQVLSKQGIRWLKAHRVKSNEDLASIEDFPGDYVLLDAWSDKEYGGTGKTLDWELLNKSEIKKQIILAGGLKPENVREAIKAANPYAIDVSSGVEELPGVKSIAKVKKLLNEIHD